jgi:hypothetical protein
MQIGRCQTATVIDAKAHQVLPSAVHAMGTEKFMADEDSR